MLKRHFSIAAVLILMCVSGERVPGAAVSNWENGPGFRRAPLHPSPGGGPGFTELPPSILGIHWTNQLSAARYSERQNLMNGAGVALGDFDGDGWCDIYLCNKEGPNALLRNLGGWRFQDVAGPAGVTCTNQSSSGAVFADLNGDRRLDLLVTSFTGPNACFLNLGHGQFTNVTAAAGLTSKGGGTSQALGDLDGDGDLDLYVAYFGIEAVLRDGGAYATRIVNGKPIVTGRYAKRLVIIDNRVVELGEPDILYLNNGQGRFTPVNWTDTFRDEAGQPMAPPADFGLAVQIHDLNGDGHPDVYVCNDFQTPDRIWLNDGRGRFRAIERLALRNMSYASMGVDFADVNRDGWTDIFTVEMLSRRPTRRLNQSSPMGPVTRFIGVSEDREEMTRNALFVNRGDGTYAETAFFSGLAASDWSWATVFLDVDLDGYEDILVANGHLHDVNDRDVAASRLAPAPPSRGETGRNALRSPRLDPPKAAFRNQGDLTFADVSDAWGFNSRLIAHGLGLADLDNDGDLDVVANCLQSAPLLYRNNASAPRIAIRLKGEAPNTQGIGARITVRGGPVVQAQEIVCGGRYLSGDDPVRTFAAGGPTNRWTIEVRWRSGRRSLVANAAPNSLYEIDEAAAPPGGAELRPSPLAHSPPLFQDVSDRLAHVHHENAFDDFARQPLLPKKLSQLGPGVAWVDLDGDGHDELIIGAGQGGSLAIFRNDGKGGFKPGPASSLSSRTGDDLTGLVDWRTPDGGRSVLAGVSNYESGATHTPSVLRFRLKNGAVESATAVTGSVPGAGPLAVADVDGDGDLDVFVGGRVNPGRYPRPASSRLFRNEGGQLVLDLENGRVLEKLGLVSGAVFSDLNGDGQPELVLAVEWGPIEVFQNNHGRLKPWNAPVSPRPGLPSFASRMATMDQLRQFHGLWNSVTTGDIDGDGRLDIIAGNWGLNSYYQLASGEPWRLVFGDLDDDGQIEIIEAQVDPELKKLVPWRDLASVATTLPWVRERFQSNQDYARAGVPKILGDRSTQATELQAGILASIVLFNRGDHFEADALPMEAQWSPAFGVNVGDANGDGHEDVFLSQNFFAVRPDDGRLDSGRGLWLLGAGKGGLKPAPGPVSGVKIYGEQRGSALADFDGDGRLDLVVAQNGAPTKLYRNTGARPGLRVRLHGPKENPAGIGSTLRLHFGSRIGPAREIHGGSGYWSQDSVVTVLATPEPPTAISVRWPGGRTGTAPIPSGAREIELDPAGQVTASGVRP